MFSSAPLLGLKSLVNDFHGEIDVNFFDGQMKKYYEVGRRVHEGLSPLTDRTVFPAVPGLSRQPPGPCFP